MQITDQQLLSKISAQSKVSFDLFYARYQALFYELALSRTKDTEIANDIMQNFWMIIWQKPETIKTDENGSCKKYLYIYFTSRMSDYLYAASTKLLSNHEENALEEAAKELSYSHVLEDMAIKEIMELIETTIQRMPELTRQIFIKRWKEGYSNKEVSEILSMSESAINERYNDGISIVRKKIVSIYPNNSYILLIGLYLLSKQ